MSNSERNANNERFAIVAWLQNHASESASDGYKEDARAFQFCADSVNRGDHLKGIIMEAKYLRTKPAAEYLGIGQSTLERKRIDGTGPKYRKLGPRIVTYAISDLDDWAGQAQNSTSENQ